MENIHSETYSLLIDTYITDETEKTKLFNGLKLFLVLKKENGRLNGLKIKNQF